MNRKIFSERFNRELAMMGFPDEVADKTQAIVKSFRVTSYLANGMIFGHLIPPEPHLSKIAAALDVCVDWLCGVTDKKKPYTPQDVVVQTEGESVS